MTVNVTVYQSHGCVLTPEILPIKQLAFNAYLPVNDCEQFSLF